MPQAQLQAFLAECYDYQWLECDGMTRVVDYLLATAGIEHRCFIGRVENTDTAEAMSPHFWVEMEAITVDFALRRWFGNRPDIPHGVFRRADYPNLHYEGEEIELEVSKEIYEILTGPLMSIGSPG